MKYKTQRSKWLIICKVRLFGYLNYEHCGHGCIIDLPDPHRKKISHFAPLCSVLVLALQSAPISRLSSLSVFTETETLLIYYLGWVISYENITCMVDKETSKNPQKILKASLKIWVPPRRMIINDKMFFKSQLICQQMPSSRFYN